jgi:hypothetical protein
MTCHAHAALCRGLEKSLSERHGRGMAQARQGMCESNMAALCKSNGKNTLTPRGNGMAGERHDMCELSFIRPCLSPLAYVIGNQAGFTDFRKKSPHLFVLDNRKIQQTKSKT